jgi:hypothetical protein
VGRGLVLRSGLEQEVYWRPSAHERKHCPPMPVCGVA